MPVKPIPDGYSTVTPYLVMQGASRALEFYRQAFAAKERFRMDAPGGGIMHAEIQIGNSVVMLADEAPEMGYRGPQALGGTPVSIVLYVTDVDAVFKSAVAAGAQVTRPPKNEFYGDRMATVTDPFGHVWSIATHVEDVSPEEMQRRFAAMQKPGS
jgi:PhnB protein